MERSRRDGVAGFSLIEILMVLVVLGILMSLGISSYVRELQKRTFQQDVMAMLYPIEEARSTSVKTSRDQTVQLSASGNNIVLTWGSKTLRFNNLTMCVPSGAGCATTTQFTYRSPHGEVCWGNPCVTMDQAIRFSRNNNSLQLVLQGVFGYASIRDLQ
ncbi:pilus assembly FimT family protein [Deinococcus misasensis]|uniref:pilus assembly FimT family protein n=1 Tax=Deinococcus misasensis TaxID=392413 RepID=UPI00054DFEDA|nr:prepilin-type N-terminal cleavage/methylation domain-containing protein [Deinococcus misasensis]